MRENSLILKSSIIINELRIDICAFIKYNHEIFKIKLKCFILLDSIIKINLKITKHLTFLIIFFISN